MAASGAIAGRMSAAAYFGLVALVTALGFAGAMALRPAFSHFVLRSVGLEAMPLAAPGSFYAVRVAPLFEARCTGCHGARIQKAQLRLDSFAFAMQGGRHGAVIQPGNPKASELFTRINLPTADDKAMPPSGKTPLTKDEVTVIGLWIAAGASGQLPVGAIKNAPKPVVEVKIPEVDLRRVQQQRAPLAAAVRQLQARFPGVLDYESRSTADLEVNASLMGPAFGDAALRALAPVQGRIVRADFSGTAISDASALAAMTSLRRLRLANTKLSAASIQALRQRGVVVYGAGDAH